MSSVTQRHENIQKSPSDDKEYLGLTLPNKLRVVLIRDPKAELSSAAMSVDVGNLKDPKEFMGIAHFLEHMLFIGSEKYPEDSTYKKFITNNGGACNASTSSSRTEYHFSIKCEKLLEALDIFAQFFISPLLSDDCTNREVNAVDSEASKNYNQDSRRLYQLSRHLADQESVYNKFGTGNLDTLNKPGLREALKEFHQKYYSADIMSLAVYHNDDLHELAGKIEALFSQVPNKDLGKISYPGEKHPYSPERRGKMAKFPPVLNKHSLSLNFMLNDMSEHREQKPLNYVSHLVGHECEGSLANHLIQDGYCVSLSCGSSTLDGLFTYVSINMELTEKGLQNLEYVLEAVGAYLSFLRENGIHQWIYDECKSTSEISFKFKNNYGPLASVKTITENLKYFSIENCLIGNYTYSGFEADLVKSIFSELVSKNLMIYFSSQKFSSDEFTDSEPIYKTKYSVKDLEDQLKAKMDRPWSQVDSKFKEVFALPHKNDLIPKNTDMIPIVTSAEKPEVPEVILNDERVLLYHQPETSFRVPKAECWIQVADNTLNHYFDRRVDLLYSLWTRVLTHVFRSEKYYFNLAMASLTVSHDRYGLNFEITGFSDTIAAAAGRLVEQCKHVNEFIDEEQFYRMKEKMVKQYENTLKAQPSSTVRIRLEDNLKAYLPTFEYSAEAIKEITWAEFKEFRDKVFRSKIKFTCFVGGNLSKESSTELIKTFVDKFTDLYKPASYMKPEDFADFRIVQLPPKKTYIYRTTNVVETEDNYGIQLYYQMGDYQKHRSALNFVATFIKQKYFYELRTKQQLGYVVSSGVISIRNVYGFVLFVQSNHKSSEFCRLRTEEFIEQARGLIVNIEDTEFDDIVQGMLSQIRRPYSNIYEVIGSRLSQIINNQFEYDLRQNVEREILALTKQAVIECFESIFHADRSRLEVHIVPQKKLQIAEEELLDRLFGPKEAQATETGSGEGKLESKVQKVEEAEKREDSRVGLLREGEPLVEVNERVTLINNPVVFKKSCSLFPDFQRKTV